MKLCSASRLCSMNSWVIWNFCTAFFSGTGGTMMPAGIAAAWHMAPKARLQTEAAAKGYQGKAVEMKSNHTRSPLWRV